LPLTYIPLCRTVASQFTAATSGIPDLHPILRDYSWPGNIRQLQNALQYAQIRCKGAVVLPEHLPVEIMESSYASTIPSSRLQKKSGHRPKLREDAVREALHETRGNKARAAKLLGVSRATLYRFLEKTGSSSYEWH